VTRRPARSDPLKFASASAGAQIRLSLPLNPTGNRLYSRKTLLRQKLGSLAVVNDERRGIFTTGKVERAALLTIEACDLARVHYQTNASRR
jgi:hypothetical protein